MKSAFLGLIALVSLSANATSYTYCRDGNLYSCGEGDACDPQPCHVVGNCTASLVLAIQNLGQSVDLQADNRLIVRSLSVDARTCK